MAIWDSRGEEMDFPYAAVVCFCCSCCLFFVCVVFFVCLSYFVLTSNIMLDKVIHHARQSYTGQSKSCPPSGPAPKPILSLASAVVGRGALEAAHAPAVPLRVPTVCTRSR